MVVLTKCIQGYIDLSTWRDMLPLGSAEFRRLRGIFQFTFPCTGRLTSALKVTPGPRTPRTLQGLSRDPQGRCQDAPRTLQGHL